MTPRLRLLLMGLGLSMSVLIFDQINNYRVKSSKKASRAKSAPKKQVITKKEETPATVIASTPKVNNDQRRSAQTSQLVGWQRNPFSTLSLSTESNTEAGFNSEKNIEADKSILLKNLERYNVEIVAEFNNDKVVLIDGKRFRQGDFLNDILIETIENDQITFKMGNTRVIKSVGN